MDRIYLNDLFDQYSTLLTEHECLVFMDYYQNDLSLAEIALNQNVSRSAIAKTIKVVTNKLNDYEAKLKLNYKNKAILKCLANKNYDKIEKILG